MPDAPEPARASPEIDAYPESAKLWELAEAQRTTDDIPSSASEHIDGLFGWHSPFVRSEIAKIGRTAERTRA